MAKRDAAEVIHEMTTRGDFSRLGISVPDVGEVEELVRGVEQAAHSLTATMPKPWDEMTNEEQDAWFASQGVKTLTPDEARTQYGDATVIIFGTPHHALEPGSLVAVEHPDSSWHNRMRAVSAADGLVYVADDDEYQRAEQESRTPLTIAYPVDLVKPADK